MKHEIAFTHGLGDCANFARTLPLWIDRGYEITVHTDENKRVLFELAGAKIGEGRGTKHHPWEHHGSCQPSTGKGWTGNKSGENLFCPSMPDIGRPGELWDKYKQVNLSDPVGECPYVDEAIENLPRPLILLHTTGNTSQAAKSMPREFHIPFYRELLATQGTVIGLDWDRRTPNVDHYRYRASEELFTQGLSLRNLIYLIRAADLMIGVDSGPLHTAAGFTRTPTVGLFTQHHYAASFLVPAPHVLAVNLPHGLNRWKRAEYRIWENTSEHYDPQTVGNVCRQMLVHEPANAAASVQLEQYLEFVQAGATPVHPLADRGHTMRLFLDLAKFSGHPRIVETGCIRAQEDWDGAGFSTFLFGHYVTMNGGRLDSVDLDSRNVKFAQQWTADYDRVEIHQGRGNEFIATKDRIDALYLDSADTEHPRHADINLEEFKAAEAINQPPRVVLIDDTPYRDGGEGFQGKGAKTVPYALSKGWTIALAGYQVLLTNLRI